MTSEIKQRFSNALHLNEQNAHKEAYLEYLSTLSLIASELQNINKNVEGEKKYYFDLAKKCLDQAEIVYSFIHQSESTQNSNSNKVGSEDEHLKKDEEVEFGNSNSENQSYFSGFQKLKSKFSEMKISTKFDEDWQRKLQSNSNDVNLIKTYLNNVLLIPSHSFGKKLIEFSKKLNDEMKTYTQNDLPKIKQEILDFLASMETTAISTLKNIEIHYDLEMVIHSHLRETLFDQLYEKLFPLYKAKNEQKDLKLMSQFHILSEIKTKDLGVNPKFQLDELHQDAFFPTIDLLREMIIKFTLEQKFQCLDEAIKALCTSISQYYNKDNIILGGDDIIPLFTFCLIQAAVPNLFSEQDFITDFISEDETLGQYGYLLASLQTSLEFIMGADPEQLKNSSKLVPSPTLKNRLLNSQIQQSDIDLDFPILGNSGDKIEDKSEIKIDVEPETSTLNEMENESKNTVESEIINETEIKTQPQIENQIETTNKEQMNE